MALVRKVFGTAEKQVPFPREDIYGWGNVLGRAYRPYEKREPAMVLFLCAGEGNRKYVTLILDVKLIRGNLAHVIPLIINYLATLLSTCINANQ